MTKLAWLVFLSFPLFSQTFSLPSGPSLPDACKVGDLFFSTSQPPGKNIFGCIPANSWVAESVGKELFTATGRKTVARTALSKLEEQVSLRDFGCAGNGIIDDSACVSAWLSDVISHHRRGFCPDGVYKVTTPITYRVNSNGGDDNNFTGTVIQGVRGGCSLMWSQNGTGVMITLVGSRGMQQEKVTITGIRFVRDNVSTGASAALLRLDGIAGLFLNQNDFEGPILNQAHTLWLSATQQGEIGGNNFTGAGILYDDPLKTGATGPLEIHGSNVAGMGNHYFFEHKGGDSWLHNNHMVQGGACIYSDTGVTKPPFSTIVATDNHCENMSVVGFYINGSELYAKGNQIYMSEGIPAIDTVIGRSWIDLNHIGGGDIIFRSGACAGADPALTFCRIFGNDYYGSLLDHTAYHQVQNFMNIKAGNNPRSTISSRLEDPLKITTFQIGGSVKLLDLQGNNHQPQNVSESLSATGNGTATFTLGTGSAHDFGIQSSTAQDHLSVIKDGVEYIRATPANTTFAKPITLAGSPLAALGNPPNGTIQLCTDCTVTNPCAAKGTGALAKRLNNVWVCN